MSKTDILAKAIRLADKRAVRPESVVISKPPVAKTKPAAEILSARLYTRITPGEMRRLRARIGTVFTVSELLRVLLNQYLDKQDDSHGRKKT